MPEKVFCPNCGQPATQADGGIFCEQCDATFVVTTKEAKVKKIGPLAELQERVFKLEALQKESPESDELEAPGKPPESNSDDEEEDIL